jgi:hypothetical protein
VAAFGAVYGEVLLRGDVLGHRLVDVEQPRLVTAHDVQLARTGNGWVATAVDIHPRGLGDVRVRYMLEDRGRMRSGRTSAGVSGSIIEAGCTAT